MLGPVLFLIFINDLPEALKCTVRLFADDTKLYTEFTNGEEGIQLQDDIFNACEWSRKWNLVFNSKKCKSLHIGNKEKDTYYIKGINDTIEEIKSVEKEKDLGVIFDKDLKFSNNISEKVKIANRNLGIICKVLRTVLDVVAI